MALKLGELKYILSLNPKNFLSTLEKVEGQFEKSAAKIEKPLDISSSNNVDGLVKKIATLGLAYSGVKDLVGSLSGALSNLNSVYLDQEKSVRRIAAASKLTGVPLTELQEISAELEKRFGVTTQQANEFTVAANKLTVAAKKPGKTLETLVKLFDLSAGQGLDAAESLERFKQAIVGMDEGTEALFSGKNPIDIYTEYSKVIGVSAAKMDDAQKKQAILNAVVRDGGILQGSYNEFLQDAAGKQSLAANKAQELRAELGKLLNDVYVPILEVANPILKMFSELDEETRKTTLAATAFLVVGTKIPGLLNAIRGGVLALTRSIGILGVLSVAFGSVVTAIVAYIAASKKAEDFTDKLKKKSKSLADSFSFLGKAIEKAYGSSEISDLIKLQEFFSKKLSESRKKLVEMNAAREAGAEISKKELEDAKFFVVANEQRLKIIEEFIAKRRRLLASAETELTKTQFEAEQKRQAFLRESNRISLEEYLKYLVSRQEIARKLLGEESLEYLKFQDEVTKVRVEGLAESAKKAELEVRKTVSDVTDFLKNSQAGLAESFLSDIEKLEIDFSNRSMEQLESQSQGINAVLQQRLDFAASVYGRESEEYQKAIEKRQLIDIQYASAKKAIEIRSVQEVITLGGQLLTAFQGQSQALFSIGKGLSIAETLINSYQAVSRAYKDYPFPANIAIAAIQGALALAQVQKIRATNFKAKGFQEGGVISLSDLIPSGEQGLVAVQSGEMVLNRGAVGRFRPLLEEMNAKRNSKIRSVDGQSFPTGDIVKAIRDIKIVNQYRVEADFVQVLREKFPEYERQEDRLTF